jgi:hypothetical protein
VAVNGVRVVVTLMLRPGTTVSVADVTPQAFSAGVLDGYAGWHVGEGQGIGANLTNDEKRAHLIDLKREHLIDQVCPQEILPPEK